MAENNHSLLESWPGLKEDLAAFLSDTDAWVIFELKNAAENRDWDAVDRIIEVMDFVHNLSHHH